MNKIGRNLMVTVALLVFANFANAQTYSNGNEIKKADVNMTELANYYLTHPLPAVRRMPMDEEEDEQRPRHVKPNPSEIHMIKRNFDQNAPEGPHGAYLPVSPAPNDTFLSTQTAGTIIPPDTHGAVDSQYCVTAINTVIHIQRRSGAHVSYAGLDGFWSAVLPSGASSFDPRVHYDNFNKRWIMVTDAVRATTSGTTTTYDRSTIMIAVSATSDPTGTWHMYAIPVDPSGASWLDFPNVGYNNRWITVTGNMFQGSSGSRVYVFNYANIMAGTGAPYTMITQSGSFALCPALTYDPTQSNQFVIETSSGSSGRLRLWKISGSTGSPTMSSIGYPTTTTHWSSGGSGGGDQGPQVGTTNKVNLGDHRITNVIYRNHKLWCAHTAFLPSSGTTTHSAIMWWQIDTLANPIQNGMVNNTSPLTFYAYPTIAVNANDDALLGFAVLNSTIHPSAGYALHLSSEPLDSVHPAYIYRHGQASYYETFGGTRNRWGDYSGTCVDPRNDTDFWTIQEASMVAASPNWDTWWAKVQFCPKPNAPTILSPGSVCIGAAATYSVVPVAGATSYQWTVSGTGWVGSASTLDTFSIIAGTGVGTITVLAYNSCGQGESQVLNITPATVPVTPSISTSTPACVGSPTAVFVAIASGATSYNWTTIGTGWSGSGGSSALTATVGTGTALIICSALNACGSSAPDTISVTPAIVPTSHYSVTAHVVNVNVNDIITFTGTAPAGTTYTWDFGGGSATPGTGAGPQTVFWSIAGTKTVTLSLDNGGCTSAYSDTVHVRDPAAVKQLNGGDAAIQIMPNPNSGAFKIVFNTPVNKAVTVSITDMQGRMVYSNDYGIVNNEIQVTAKDLVPGSYTVSIITDGTSINKKITITR